MYPQTKLQANAPPTREPLNDDSDDGDDEDKRTIFCANIDQRVTEEILYEVFLQAGPIESVRIPKDNGGRQKTFGFITYIHQCSVPFALKLLAGLCLFKKALTIKTKYVHAPGFPTDCVPLHRRGSGVVARELGLRTYIDENPFKRDITPPKRVEWGSQQQQQRRSDELKKHSSHNSRPHQNTPYSRVDPSRDRGGGGGGGSGGGGYQNRHNNNNRRSEQRNRHR